MENKKNPMRAAVRAAVVVGIIGILFITAVTLFGPMLPMDPERSGEIDYSQVTPQMVESAQAVTTAYAMGVPLLCLVGIIAPIVAYRRAKRGWVQPDVVGG